MIQKSKHILGIDLGNTIVRAQRASDATPGVRVPPEPFPGALETIAQLVPKFKAVYVLSRVTPEQKVRALQWLAISKFHEKTGVPAGNVLFCESRHEKAPICHQLQVTHFIDDRPEVLSHMGGIFKLIYNPNPEDVDKYRAKLENAVIVNNWEEIQIVFGLI